MIPNMGAPDPATLKHAADLLDQQLQAGGRVDCTAGKEWRQSLPCSSPGGRVSVVSMTTPYTERMPHFGIGPIDTPSASG